MAGVLVNRPVGRTAFRYADGANGRHDAFPHLKPGAKLDAMDYMLFPDDANDLPDDVSEQEKQWMLKLSRIG